MRAHTRVLWRRRVVTGARAGGFFGIELEHSYLWVERGPRNARFGPGASSSCVRVYTRVHTTRKLSDETSQTSRRGDFARNRRRLARSRFTTRATHGVRGAVIGKRTRKRRASPFILENRDGFRCPHSRRRFGWKPCARFVSKRRTRTDSGRRTRRSRAGPIETAAGRKNYDHFSPYDTALGLQCGREERTRKTTGARVGLIYSM